MHLKTVLLALALVLGLSAQAKQAPIPSGIDHGPLNVLLEKYVDSEGLVDYKSWHSSREDRAELAAYLKQFAPRPRIPAGGDEAIAALINAYNAFTIQFILNNYPTKSIRLLDHEFDGRRYRIGGEDLSADDIELDMLRARIGWKMHSVVVCAARSCPPLLNAAYFPEDWEEKMEERYRAWLAREDLNRYFPEDNRVKISKIFKWHAFDFEGANKPDVAKTLARFGPQAYHGFLKKGGFEIDYMDYHWGLNTQSDLGKDYKHSWLRSIF